MFILHPMSGMSLREQEEWFNSRIKGVFDDEPPISAPMITPRLERNPDDNVIQFKPRSN